MTEAEITERLALIDSQIDELLADPVEELAYKDRRARMRDLEQLQRMRERYQKMLSRAESSGRPAVGCFRTPS